MKLLGFKLILSVQIILQFTLQQFHYLKSKEEILKKMSFLKAYALKLWKLFVVLMKVIALSTEISIFSSDPYDYKYFATVSSL